MNVTCDFIILKLISFSSVFFIVNYKHKLHIILSINMFLVFPTFAASGLFTKEGNWIHNIIVFYLSIHILRLTIRLFLNYNNFYNRNLFFEKKFMIINFVVSNRYTPSASLFLECMELTEFDGLYRKSEVRDHSSLRAVGNVRVLRIYGALQIFKPYDLTFTLLARFFKLLAI